MTLTGKDPHIIKESIPVRLLLYTEKSPHMNQIGLLQGRGTPDGKMSSHLSQDKVSIMVKLGTEETGDHHTIDLEGSHNHIFQEMKGILGHLGETEGHPFQAMNLTEGFLFHLIKEVEDLLGLMMQDPHSQGMNVIDPPFQGMSDIPGKIGMDGQGLEMIVSHLSSGLIRKQVNVKQIISPLSNSLARWMSKHINHQIKNQHKRKRGTDHHSLERSMTGHLSLKMSWTGLHS